MNYKLGKINKFVGCSVRDLLVLGFSRKNNIWYLPYKWNLKNARQPEVIYIKDGRSRLRATFIKNHKSLSLYRRYFSQLKLNDKKLVGCIIDREKKETIKVTDVVSYDKSMVEKNNPGPALSTLAEDVLHKRYPNYKNPIAYWTE